MEKNEKPVLKSIEKETQKNQTKNNKPIQDQQPKLIE